MSHAGLVDSRSTRFAAAVAAVVLLGALLLGPVYGLVPLAVQTMVFACGAVLGVQAEPYAIAFRRLVRPRLAAPKSLEPARPSRFADGLSLVISLVGLLGGVLGLGVVFYAATALALVAALLTAAFDYSLGRAVYRSLLGSPTRVTTSEHREDAPVG